MTTFEDEKEAFLAHYGVPGMRWGKRKAAVGKSGTTQKQRNEAFKKNPTAREYLLGKGKNYEQRTDSRKTAGKISAGLILASAAAKIAVNNIPQLKQYSAGVSIVANGIQAGSWAVAAGSLAAQGIDRATQN